MAACDSSSTEATASSCLRTYGSHRPAHPWIRGPESDRQTTGSSCRASPRRLATWGRCADATAPRSQCEVAHGTERRDERYFAPVGASVGQPVTSIEGWTMIPNEPDAEVWRQLFASLTGNSTVDAAVLREFSATPTASRRHRSWPRCTITAGLRIKRSEAAWRRWRKAASERCARLRFTQPPGRAGEPPTW